MQKKRHKINPTKLGLRHAEIQVLRIVQKLEQKGKIVTTGIISRMWKNKDRSWIYLNLKSLEKKGYIEIYERKYYRLKG